MIRRSFLKMLLASPLLGLLKKKEELKVKDLLECDLKGAKPDDDGTIDLYLEVGKHTLALAGPDRCVCGTVFPDYGIPTQGESYMFYCRCGRQYFFGKIARNPSNANDS